MQAVIFDMDGLMIDSEKIYWAVGRELAREYGKEVSDQTLGRMMGRSPIDSVALFARDLGLTQSPLELHEIRETRVQRALEQGVDAMPGLFEALAQLKPRYRLGIATSAPMRLVEIVLRKLDIGHYFDAVQTSDGIARGKPDPEIYLKAADKLGVPTAQCFVLEDSSNGVQAGRRAGAYVIAVPSPYTRDQDFSLAYEIATDLNDAARRILAADAARAC